MQFMSAQEAMMRKLAHPIWKFRYLALALMVFWAVPAIAQEPAAAPKPAEEVYKNIQVLKGMPSPDLMNTMKSFTKSLGVKCDFCHTMGAFEKDDKREKQTARKMIQMAHQINTDNFHGHMRVTCWTCHRGATEPESRPPQTQN